MQGIRQNDILHGNIFKGMLTIALPLMALNVINTFYSIVDTFWVGQISELSVGAVSLISPIMSCGAAFASGLSAAAMSLIAISLGANDFDKANNVATQLIKMCIVLGLGIGVCCVIFARPILNWLETPSDIYNESYWYLMGIALDFLFLFILSIFQAIRQCGGDSKTGVKINGIAACLNMVLDPILMFGFDLGIFGAALATTFSKIIVTPIALHILLNETSSTRIDFKRYSTSVPILKQIITVGIPASIGSFLASFGFVMMNKSIVSYGSIAMAAYGLGNKISNLSYIPLDSLGGALTPFIGQNLGAENVPRAKECFRKAMIMSMITSIVVTIIGFISTKYWVLLFVRDASKELMDMSCEYAYFAIGTSIFMGWFNNLSAAFNGAGKTKYTLFLSTFRLWGLRLPMITLFGMFTTLGPTGIWWSMVISNLITCIIGQCMYNFLPWFKVEIENKSSRDNLELIGD